MNLSDVHERRRITASILQQKFRNPYSGSYQRRPDRDHLTNAADVDDYEFMDSATRQQQVTAAPSNRAGRYAPTTVDHSIEKYSSNKPSYSPTEHRYLLDDQIGQWRNYNSHNVDSNNQRRHLNPVTEDESVDFAPRTNRGRRHARGRRFARSPSSSDHKKPTADQILADGCNLDEVLMEVKRRLSLPNDTSIPDSFLIKHRDKLNHLKEEREPLNRVDRRQSLFDIGFGKSGTYSKLHVLGAGTYSIVYKGVSRLTNKLIALKEIHLERDEGVPFTAIREVSLLKQLKHFNIITLHDIIYTHKTLTLVFEFVDRDLSRYMDECDYKINPQNVRLYLFQLLRALNYCHDLKILHRDIKPQNILISLTGELKLADFGLARAKSFPTKTYTDEVVTLWYRPPDVLLGNVNYGTCIDMWGVGCLFFEMAAGHTLFLSMATDQQIKCIFEIVGTPSEDDWPGINMDLEHNGIYIPRHPARDLASMAPQLDEAGVELLGLLLKCNPKQRISSRNALRHKYFASLPHEIYDLPNIASIFSLPGVRLADEQTSHNV